MKLQILISTRISVHGVDISSMHYTWHILGNILYYTRHIILGIH